jgi:hypothetical protein
MYYFAFLELVLFLLDFSLLLIDFAIQNVDSIIVLL